MAPLIGPRVLPVAELYAARLDGELFSVDERFAPVDEIDDERLRARSLREIVRPSMVAELQSALWIYGLLSPVPSVHRVAVARADRVKFPPSVRFTVREIQHLPADIAVIAGLSVTVPARILYDLAMIGGADSSRHAYDVMARWPHMGAPCAHRIRSSHNLPGKRAALQRLDEWMSSAQPALTR